MIHDQSIQSMTTIIEKHQQVLPINIEAIATDLGLMVYREKNWSDRLCGKIVRDKETGGQSGYAIYLNGNHAETRQRFTLAHEIAHFILHKDSIGDGLADDALYRSGLSSAQETMANKLAADILMPWKLVNLKLQEGISTVDDLADIFKVSSSAMSIRLGIPAG